MYGLDPQGEFTYRDGVAIIQLVFFAVYLIGGIILCIRHGFKRADGWVAIVTLSILRVLASAFQLASIRDQSNKSILGGALICEGIGLAPLTLLNMGLFVRLNKWVTTVPDRVFNVLSIVVIIGLALGIYGGWSAADNGGVGSNAEMKASVIIYLAVYVFFLALFALFAPKYKEYPKGERGLLLCFAVCIPFMLVRYVYSIVADYSDSQRYRFNQLVGDVTILLCMAVLEEIFIVACFIFAGLRLHKLPQELRDDKPDATEPDMANYQGMGVRRV